MKVTNGELVQANNALGTIEGKLPVRTSSELAKLAIKMVDPLKVFEEVRKGLVSTYQITFEEVTGKDSKKDTVIVKTKGKQENLEKFAEELNELLELEVELDVKMVKLPEKVTGTCDACHHNMDVPLQLEPSTLIALDKFVEVI